jgi:hypothetical protein
VYYIVWYKLSYQHRYAIWFSNDEGADSFYSEKGKIPCFESKQRLLQYARERTLIINEESPIKHDLDKIRTWIHNKKSNINCEEFLSAWNLFGDIAATYPSEHIKFENQTQKSINEYNKLFWGSNLIVLRGAHPKYFPSWCVHEEESIAKVMQTGFKLLNANFRIYA